MYDFCINGGGMVGSALALGLAQQNYRVALIEPFLPSDYEAGSKPDLRVSAISDASVALLKALGAWQFIEQMRVKPYTGLSVWDSPEYRTDFTAQSIDVAQLGYFVENRVLQLGCHQALGNHDNVSWFTGSKVKHITLNPNALQSDTKNNAPAVVTLESGDTIDAKWLVGADGAGSQVRQAANIGSSGWQYSQHAMGITVEMAKPVEPITWQQFTPNGPKAFLPMFDNYASLIWYDSPTELNLLTSLNNAQLKQKILAAFPEDLTHNENDFTIIDKAIFPLTRAHASHYVTNPVILIGDAAHTINPLAGQGVNLGFSDVERLLEVTAKHEPVESSTFIDKLVNDYETPRQRENALMMSAMDGFYGLFSNDIAPIKWVRNQLLFVAQRFEPAKREVLKYAIGMREWKF